MTVITGSVLTIVTLLAGMLVADAPKPPVLTDAQKDQFHKAQAMMIAANAQVIKAQLDARDAQDSFLRLNNTLCGEGFQPQTNAQDDVSCAASPKPPEKKP